MNSKELLHRQLHKGLEAACQRLENCPGLTAKVCFAKQEKIRIFAVEITIKNR
jgi:hypothetical protein